MRRLIEKDYFFNRLVETNKITSFKEWFFYSGMLFASTEKWWGKPGKRPSPHEGLDIGFFKDQKDIIRPIDHPFKVPVAADGIIIKISDDDLLGKSVFVRHEVFDASGKILHSVYAHSNPELGLQKNISVRKGDVIATVSDLKGRNLMISPHLHLSMIWLAAGYPDEMLKWQVLPETHDAVMSDPLNFFNCRYSSDSYI